MIFGLVTPEFTKLNCVQQTSISTEVSLTTFVRGSTLRHSIDQQSFVLLLLAIEQLHCYGKRATH